MNWIFNNLKRKTSLLTLALLGLISSFANAQELPAPAMADGMRSDGKIYVVVLVLATIFAGLIIYLIALDKRISKLEKTNTYSNN